MNYLNLGNQNRTYCDGCGKRITEGYVINELVDYCDDCCMEHVEDYNAMYEEGNAYWTEFDDEDEIAIGR